MADEDPVRAAWLRSMPCDRCGARPPSQLHHHTGRRAYSRRAHDADGMPLCRLCHEAFHGGRALFSGWTKLQRRQWQDATVAKYQALYTRKPDIF